jgi:hypothetical protein
MCEKAMLAYPRNQMVQIVEFRMLESQFVPDCQEHHDGELPRTANSTHHCHWRRLSSLLSVPDQAAMMRCDEDDDQLASKGPNAGSRGCAGYVLASPHAPTSKICEAEVGA